jgi:conjugative relaxase-like TrwC/TraI family protein
VSSLAGGRGPGYYLSLANLNYYAEGGEPLPLYFGTVAREMGLFGVEHDRVAIERLCAGFHPETGKALVRNAGKEDRYVGEDCTFSAPKSVSVAFAMADDELRDKIREKHLSAVKQACQFLEAEAGFARVGAQGKELVRAPLLFALFEHATSRAMDPQLHTHALLINLTAHRDGHNGRHFTAIETSDVYRYQMAAGAIYRCALAQGMQQLGFEVEQRKVGSSVGFELSAIPKSLVEEFSKRRAEIEAELKLRVGSLDAASPRYAELVALETRRSKDTERPRAELIREWQEVGREFGVDAEYLRGHLTRHREMTPDERDRRKEGIFQEGIEALSEGHAHWNKADLIRAMAERGTGKIAARDVRELAENKLRGQELVDLGDLRIKGKSVGSRRYVERTEARYTTPEVQRLERQMLVDVERLVLGPSGACRPGFVEDAIARRPTLHAEQAEAIRYLTGGPGVRVISGLAGTGKTYALQACVEAWRREDREVYGVAFQKKTATRLKEAIGEGITCDTVHKFLYQLDRGEVTLTGRSVVTLDESAMLGTKLLARLVAHVSQANGRLCLIGDAMQLQPLTAGGAHKYLAEVLGERRLENVIRQQGDFIWARQAVRAMERGEAWEAIKAYIEHGRLHVAETRDGAIARLIEQWRRDGGINAPERVYCIAATNADVKQINLAAQAERIRAGVVDPEKKLYANGVFFHEGDRLQYKLNSRVLGVDNGDLATILKVGPEKITARLDKDSREVTVDLRRYSPEKLVLGYASTTHSAQGASIDYVEILAGGGPTDQHMGYVQLSRAKFGAHVFLDKYTAGDPGLSDLIRSYSKERQKTMAHQVEKDRERTPEQRQPRERERGISLGL